MTHHIDYQILKISDLFELRLYAATTVVEAVHPLTFKDVGQNFRPLLRYITGHNRTQQHIKMTAPVLTVPVDTLASDEEDGLYNLQFILPEPWTIDTAPLPKNSDVILKPIPARKIAALRYSGRWTRENFKDYASLLHNAVNETQMTIVGQPILARYNARHWPPFFMRRNEVWIEVA